MLIIPAASRIPSFPIFNRVYRASSSRVFCGQPHCSIDISVYSERFARRMEIAGLEPHHRLAMAISGGPDSTALCVLSAGWKTGLHGGSTKGPIDGLLAIVVDHGLRTESAEEAQIVHNRVTNMGIECEIASCKWSNGRPDYGHLQETARNKRYELLHDICIEKQIDVLLVAHHEDDQAELFILRLSRNSGVLGLAGMAFTSQIFSKFPDFGSETSKPRGILLVRPLLEFSKDDMYNICRAGNQQWIEDPTNKSPLYVRNRIRMSLCNISSKFKAEILDVISACRRTRIFVDKWSDKLINEAVTIIPYGYAVIDLRTLLSAYVNDLCLSKFSTLVLQFISQRHKPVRGSALNLLSKYLCSFPCKTSLTVAGCYLCPAPGSKGTKVLVCCSVSPSFPLKIELLPFLRQNEYPRNEIERILLAGGAFSEEYNRDSFDARFLHVESSESVLSEAKKLGMISDSTHMIVASLRMEETKIFASKTDDSTESKVNRDVKSTRLASSRFLLPGQKGYFMNRFIVGWNISESNPKEDETGFGQCFCRSFMSGDEISIEVRNMIDNDWIYLSDIARNHSASKFKHFDGIDSFCSNFIELSAERALDSLKAIPVAARRALPVFVDSRGVLLSIPSIGFKHCSCLTFTAEFCPRVPLDGGHCSFL